MGTKVRRRLTPDGGAWESFTAGRWDRVGRTGDVGIVVVNRPTVFQGRWAVIRHARQIGRFSTLREAQDWVDALLATEREALGRRLSLEAVFND